MFKSITLHTVSRVFRGTILRICILLVTFAGMVHGAEIRGVVTDDATQLPISADIYIVAVTDDPCGSPLFTANAVVSKSDGTYTMTIDVGTYHLRTYVTEGNYFDDWWTGSTSSRSCGDADQIVVSSADAIVADKNFQLDKGASIAGTVLSSETGLPVTGLSVTVNLYTGNACSPIGVQQASQRFIDQQSGAFYLAPLEPGNYYLQTHVIDESLVDEWWDTPYSRVDCTLASEITVAGNESITGKDFQLLDRPPFAGDVNMDGAISLNDAILTLQLLTRQTTSQRVYLEGDTNQDDKLDLAEVIYILTEIAGG